ncbi:MAG: OmpA family protein [bacterium]|nr:OmpA family protein [bacterium]
MKQDYYSNSKDYINRWVVSYADFVTMLLALFMVMFSISQIDNKRLEEFNQKMQQIFVEQGFDNVTKSQHKERIENIEKILENNISRKSAINFVESDKGVIIRLNDKLLFDEGKADIKPEAYKTLNEIVTVLTKLDNPVIIEGHTDSVPIKNKQFPSNWELSTSRATNIIAYLLKTQKISPKRLSAVGYGEYMPIASNTTNSGRIANRRVDIIVLEK